MECVKFKSIERPVSPDPRSRCFGWSKASAIEPDRKIFSSFAVTGESEDIWQRSMGLLDLMRQRDLEAREVRHLISRT